MTSPSPRRILGNLARAALISALACSLTPAAVQAAGSSKVDSALEQQLAKGKSGDRTRVIIRVKRGKRGDLTGQLKSAGYSVKAQHALINAVTVEVPVQALEGLARNPNVESI